MIILLLLLLLLFLALNLVVAYSAPPIAKPGCQEQCGNVPIPYPFGIGRNCYHDGHYEIICNASIHPPKPILHKFNLEVMDILWEGRNPRVYPLGQDQLITVGAVVENMCRSNASIDFGGSPYSFSNEYNVLVMEGCGGSVVLNNRSGDILAGCATICSNDTVDSTLKDLYGLGGCQATLTDTSSLDFYQLDLELGANSSACDMRVGLIDKHSVNTFTKSTLPTILEWVGPFRHVQGQARDQVGSSCYGHSCHCEMNFEGNPYLPNGCQVVRECRKCKHRCGLDFDDRGNWRFYCFKSRLLKWGSILGYCLSLGLMVMLLGCYWLYRVVKKRKNVRRKSEHFKRNGGLLLQQQIGLTEGAPQKTKVFSVTDLEKATDNFNKNRILGQGGQGTVYKGMLKDGRIVAVKKSKKIDESQLEQFINEVVILSEINHRNVVRLLGCCLETEVPLLVYEFIQNGTLYQHIHNPSEDFHITWKMRLQMAVESADAIAYLHSYSSAPIYHRDIKSSNILLDAQYRAKVSDFGTSKSIDIEQTHVTTCVMGTYGYLDPEYFQSNQFTEKSDVYSFGVVLVELMTGKKPICSNKDGGWISLAVEFLLHIETSRLFDILDTRVLDEGKEEEFVVVAELARQCLNMNGKERPTMKEIVMILDRIRSSHVPYSSTEPNCLVEKGLVMEMSDKHSGSSSTSLSFSLVDFVASSIEVQQSMMHTL